jgi:4-amino-4-deoxy-L-arabinose transferase-like glycosyltransferase
MTEIPRTPCVSDGGFRRLIPRSLLWAVLAALAVRLIVVGFVYPGFLEPGREHWEFGFEEGRIARSIAQGQGFGSPYYGGNTGPTAELAPLMPYIVAGVFVLFGIYTKAAALVLLSLNSLLSALTCIPIFFITERSFGSRKARWAVWIWAFFPYAINFSANSMWDHALLALLMTCIFWFALSLQDSVERLCWVGFGLLCGASALVNPVVLGVTPFLAGWACYRLQRKKKAWIPNALSAALALTLVLTPWLIRNYRTFHHMVFLKDNLPLAFCVGNIGNSLHWWNGSAHPSGNARELEEFDRIGEQAYMAQKWSEARRFVADYPGVFIWRSARRFVYMWTGYWSVDREYLHEEPFDIANIPFCTMTTLLAFIGLGKAFRKRASQAAPCAIMLAFFPLVYYLTEPDMAYRQPIDPEIVILASCAIVSWLRIPE